MIEHILDPDNKPVYKDGDRVEVALLANADVIYRGTIVGLSSAGILDMWVVLLDEKGEFPYRTITVQHTEIRPEFSNRPFVFQM